MNQKTRGLSILSILVMLTLVLAACSPNATQPTDTSAPTAMSATATTAPTTAPAVAVTLKVSSTDTLGSFLTDQNGMTLYLWKKDSAGTTNCTGACLQNWPALLTSAAPVAGDPSIKGKLGTITRPEGGQQVTYNDIPLYYYIKDTKAGDTNGQGVGKVWYIVAPSTTIVSAAATLKVSQNATLGSFLTDQNGMTLYMYSKDTNGASTCFGGCLAAWPALLTNGAPVAGDASITGQLGVTTRPDGSQQVTYNGSPLYYFLKDKAAGDTTGQGVGSVWFVVPPSPTAAATATTAPAAVAATPSGPATLKVSSNATLGSFLVDSQGMTLYIFTKDTSGVSNCSGTCLVSWPALLTNGTPVAGDPSITGTLGVITRSDGTQQVTFNGMPLYYYAKDKATGDTNGQGVGSVWFVVQPNGTPKK
jgi:predicted lipoprotein with Yx(FWY)xxD motif